MSGTPVDVPQSDTALLERVAPESTPATPWQVILHNDPVNLTDVVTAVLMRVLKCTQPRAEHLMLLAHTEGRVAVLDGDLSTCEPIANQLMSASLWATLEKADA